MSPHRSSGHLPVDKKGTSVAVEVENLVTIISNEELDEVAGDDSSRSSWWNGNFVTWVVLYALLIVQFVAVFCMSGTEATVTMGLRWSVLSYVIVMFVVNATLFRQTITYCKLPWTVVFLAPEIFINIMLGLVMLDQLDAAFLLMLGSILCLAILVVVISIRGLIAASSSVEEDGCKQLQDKVDVNLFKQGGTSEGGRCTAASEPALKLCKLRSGTQKLLLFLTALDDTLS
jgi:hypothetical protein